MAKPDVKKLLEDYGPPKKRGYQEQVKHAVRTEHTGKFRPKDGGSNGGYDTKPDPKP